jgi:hypothetical protein
MPINFDALPQTKPEGGGNFTLPEPGIHKAVIKEAVVKTSSAGNQYLEVVLELESGGKIWDRIMDSDKPALQFKLSRFIRACRIPLSGSMEFSDMILLVKGVTLYADITHKENTWDGKTTMKAEVDLFSNEIYYLPEDMQDAAPTTPTASGTY